MESWGQTSTFSLYKETCTDVILLPWLDLSGTATTRETLTEHTLLNMNLTDCDDAFMKQKELLFLPLALLDFQIQRCFIPAPPHLCNHQHFLRKPIH
ncbi:hypothetical protein F7725_011721 [Dissostichus mawsoni]|uniref:Uncharacterized protein n=1 Tax=Dissostichus mawsoni TaxID=36200 RepID=A0A7J5ZA85_DISMA|nr:hypothetical protein F7725_011721 [Dissostichus mawsoni]